PAEGAGHDLDQPEGYVNFSDSHRAEGLADHVEELVEAIGLRPPCLVGLPHREGEPERASKALRDLIDGDRLELVLAVAQYGHRGQTTDHAGEHGHELIARTEDEGGADDGADAR